MCASLRYDPRDGDYTCGRHAAGVGEWHILYAILPDHPAGPSCPARPRTSTGRANVGSWFYRGAVMSTIPSVAIADIARHDGQSVTLAGWVAHKTEKGKLVFIRLRDGS